MALLILCSSSAYALFFFPRVCSWRCRHMISWQVMLFAIEQQESSNYLAFDGFRTATRAAPQQGTKQLLQNAQHQQVQEYSSLWMCACVFVYVYVYLSYLCSLLWKGASFLPRSGFKWHWFFAESRHVYWLVIFFSFSCQFSVKHLAC